MEVLSPLELQLVDENLLKIAALKLVANGDEESRDDRHCNLRQDASDHDFLCNVIRFGGGLPMTVTLTASVLYKLGLESVGLLQPFINSLSGGSKCCLGVNLHERSGGNETGFQSFSGRASDSVALATPPEISPNSKFLEKVTRQLGGMQYVLEILYSSWMHSKVISVSHNDGATADLMFSLTVLLVDEQAAS